MCLLSLHFCTALGDHLRLTWKYFPFSMRPQRLKYTRNRLLTVNIRCMRLKRMHHTLHLRGDSFVSALWLAKIRQGNCRDSLISQGDQWIWRVNRWHTACVRFRRSDDKGQRTRQDEQIEKQSPSLGGKSECPREERR